MLQPHDHYRKQTHRSATYAPFLEPYRQAEFADAVRSLLSTDGYPLTGDDPLASLARNAARTLIETGVLRASGYQDRQRGTGGACPVTSHRGQRTRPGR